MDLDLDIVIGKQPTVKLFGKDVAFRDLTVEEFLKMEFLLQEIDAIPMTSPDELAEAVGKIHEYLHGVLDITKAEAKKVKIEQFRAFRQYLARKDLYDQGFSDEDIDRLESEALKKKAAQILE